MHDTSGKSRGLILCILGSSCFKLLLVTSVGLENDAFQVQPSLTLMYRPNRPSLARKLVEKPVQKGKITPLSLQSLIRAAKLSLIKCNHLFCFLFTFPIFGLHGVRSLVQFSSIELNAKPNLHEGGVGRQLVRERARKPP